MLTGQHSEQKAVPRDRKVRSLIVSKMYLITMREAMDWWYLPGNTLSRRQSPGTGSPQSHHCQDVPDYHGGGNSMVVLTGQHSEQKAVPRDRKVISLAVAEMYLIAMREAIGWQCLPGNTLSRRQSPGTGRSAVSPIPRPDYQRGGAIEGWYLPGNTLSRRQSPETGRSAVSLLPRCT